MINDSYYTQNAFEISKSHKNYNYAEVCKFVEKLSSLISYKMLNCQKLIFEKKYIKILYLRRSFFFSKSNFHNNHYEELYLVLYYR